MPFDSLKNSLFNGIFCFKRTLAIHHIIHGHFHFQSCKHFLEYSGFYLLTTFYTKKQYQEFLFIYFRSYNNKSQFSFLQTVQSRSNTSYFRTSHFCVKCQYRFLALTFLYTLKKKKKEKTWKKRFWKWNLKRTPHVGPKIVFQRRRQTFLFCKRDRHIYFL